MRVTIDFLRGLSVGTDVMLEDVENVTTVPPLCTKLKRTEGKVSFKLETYPLDRKVRIRVGTYDGQGFKDSLQDVEGNQSGTIGASEQVGQPPRTE